MLDPMKVKDSLSNVRKIKNARHEQPEEVSEQKHQHNSTPPKHSKKK